MTHNKALLYSVHVVFNFLLFTYACATLLYVHENFVFITQVEYCKWQNFEEFLPTNFFKTPHNKVVPPHCLVNSETSRLSFKRPMKIDCFKNRLNIVILLLLYLHTWAKKSLFFDNVYA